MNMMYLHLVWRLYYLENKESVCVCVLTDEHDVPSSAVASVLSRVLRRECMCVYLTDEHDVSPSAVASVFS